MNAKRYSTQRKSIPEKIKMQIRIEAGHCCSICGANSPLEFHHIDEDRENNTLENIILLCCNHHREFHKGNITKKEMEEYKRRLETNRIRNDELNFYLDKIGWITNNLFLEQWSNINQMIGTEHFISDSVKDKFEEVARCIERTNFPTETHIGFNNIFNNIAISIKNLVKVFMQNPHVEYDERCKRYYLSRRWKGLRKYPQAEYDQLHQIDVNFEENLFISYMDLCLNILAFQEYIWNKLDYAYLDRVRIEATFYKYYSQ